MIDPRLGFDEFTPTVSLRLCIEQSMLPKSIYTLTLSLKKNTFSLCLYHYQYYADHQLGNICVNR